MFYKEGNIPLHSLSDTVHNLVRELLPYHKIDEIFKNIGEDPEILFESGKYLTRDEYLCGLSREVLSDILDESETLVATSIDGISLGIDSLLLVCSNEAHDLDPISTDYNDRRFVFVDTSHSIITTDIWERMKSNLSKAYSSEFEMLNRISQYAAKLEGWGVSLNKSEVPIDAQSILYRVQNYLFSSWNNSQKVGRPRKVEIISQHLSRWYQSEHEKPTWKEVEKRVIDELKMNVSESTLRRAWKKRK